MATDNRGYATKIVAANKAANQASPGVKLGQYCISREIPVHDVAEFFGVSRMTIYKWFTGEWIPRKVHEEKIVEMLKRVGFLS